ncbi:uncharacterized protein IUM83_12260 [Phytophthora cinnamomi]|nr:hypothetical protein IUM83_12260 [Phytophthora cinnamomi]
MCGVAEDDGYDADGNDYASQNNFPETDYTGQDDGHQDIIVVDNSGKPVDANTPIDVYVTDDSEKRVVNWYDQTIEAMGEFQEIWKVKEPRCKIIVDAIMNGSQPIIYESWRQDMESHFGCPEPTNSTNVTSYSGSWGSSDGTTSYTVVGSQESVENSNDTIQFPDGDSSATVATVSTWDA